MRKKEGYDASQRILGVVRLNSVLRLLFSCIQFVTFHTIFHKDSDLARGFNNERYGMFVISQKKGEIFRKRFCSKNGGRAQGPAQARGACPPFSEQKRFQNVSTLFCEIKKSHTFHY